MNKIKSIIKSFTISGAVLSSILCSTSFNVFAEEEIADNKSWQEAYLKVIDNSPEDSFPLFKDLKSSFKLFYTDDNSEIPKLYIEVIDIANDGVQYIYNYYNNETILCKNVSCRVELNFFKNGFVSERQSMRAGERDEFYFHKFENGYYKDLQSFIHDHVDSQYGKSESYFIDNEEVSEEKYYSKMTDLKEEYSMLDDNMIDMSEQYNYDEIRQYLLDSMNETSTTETTMLTDETAIETYTTVITDEIINTTAEIIESENKDTIISATKQTSDVSKNMDSPKTGDSGIISVIIGGIISVVTAFVLRKGRKNE